MKIEISAVYWGSEDVACVALGEIQSEEARVAYFSLTESGATISGVYPKRIIFHRKVYVPIAGLAEVHLPDGISIAYSFWNDSSEAYAIIRENALHVMRRYAAYIEVLPDGTVHPIWTFSY